MADGGIGQAVEVGCNLFPAAVMMFVRVEMRAHEPIRGAKTLGQNFCSHSVCEGGQIWVRCKECLRAPHYTEIESKSERHNLECNF